MRVTDLRLRAAKVLRRKRALLEGQLVAAPNAGFRGLWF